MSDLHVLDESRRGSAVAVYLERCILLLEGAFMRPDDKEKFETWMNAKLSRDSDTVLALLHEEPLYVVGRFLGIPVDKISASVMARAKELARAHHW